MGKPSTHVAVIGDVHGHLQLGLCVVARWQKELGVPFEAVFLCGDVGSFTSEDELDNATRRHASENPCELEYLRQWAVAPSAPWLDWIFRTESEEGLGLEATLIMVHGNHEGFAHLATLVPAKLPTAPVHVEDLPAVDPGRRIRYLPSGWIVALPSGCLAAGVGGIERGQRRVAYHEMAYVDASAILHILEQGRKVDLLLTHQGPASIQGAGGSPTLQTLGDRGIASAWFHGHSVHEPAIRHMGRTLVVPLDDIAFPMKGPDRDEPGREGWAAVTIDEGEIKVRREAPGFLRDFRRHNWIRTKSGQLISPALAHVAWRFRNWPMD